ncbi:MAG: TlpA disulfide reductase family protein [Bacteroidota bacterium]|nr:TlpA disulfide reductase family protein [Bacteroidota bacterium]
MISPLKAATVVIRGNSPDYAGLTLAFSLYENQISEKERPIANVKVQPNGDFEAKFEVSRTEYIFCRTGIFFLYFFAEPGKEYTLKLPPRTEKNPADKLNPYFEEIRLHLVVNSSQTQGQSAVDDPKTEINYLIRTFDDVYDPLYSKVAVKVIARFSPKNIDSTLLSLENKFSGIAHPYFKDYYTYRMGLIKMMATKFKSRHVSDNYFLNKPVLYANPAYMELFNQVYDKYFSYFGRTDEGKVIYDDINVAKSFSRLKATLSHDKVLNNDTLKEMVILKNLHDGFYEMEFSRSAMLRILDSLALSTNVPTHRAIAADIREKVTRLLPGYAPPAFSLFNQDSVLVSLNNFKGKFVYLVFCTTQSYASMKDFEMLKTLQKKHSKLLKIVAISVDDNLSVMRNYAKKSGYDFAFLHYSNQPSILKDYDVRTFPTYYLIDREGRLIMSPAPTPGEDFETKFYEYLKGMHIL